MTRRSITDEAEAQEDNNNQDQAGSNNAGSERQQLTQRMPSELVAEIDEVADTYGMSRNNAINMMCRQWLDDHT